MVREDTENVSIGADTDNSAVDPYAKHLWPRPAHPLRRKLNPRRIRQRWQTRRVVRLEYHRPPVTGGRATDMRSIELWHRDQPGWSIGKVRFLICHECRRGFIGNIDVQKNMCGQGIAARALADLRKQVPGYSWRTSLHLPGSKSFWLLIAERTGEDYTDTDRTCTHMDPFWTGGATWATTSSD
ncbi:hypothetical protein APR11_000376 [Nocardia amikacinitolerans]|uniref:hypothetical protein n=1 Tax=Nocardia amikacinitolerans TaxID=756689 RepID=UPI0020A23538|nr:hypothetical protein [Nocardia amikacinitolerans]MCP2293972.1 hypothetical protein [Nocardia amikacinitolerans]